MAEGALRTTARLTARPEIEAFLEHLAKERQVSEHTTKAYRRDLEAFVEFLDRHQGGAWTFGSVDRLGIRGYLGEMQRRGLSKRSMARALSAVRSLYRFLQVHQNLEHSPVRAAKAPRLERHLPGYLDRDRTESLFAGAEARAATGELAAVRDLSGVLAAHLYGDIVRVLFDADDTAAVEAALAGAGIDGAVRAAAVDMETAFAVLAELAREEVPR